MMTKWEKLNSELADARHYAADMKERAENAERERDELRAKLDAVPEYTFACLQAKERGEMSFMALDEWMQAVQP